MRIRHLAFLASLVVLLGIFAGCGSSTALTLWANNYRSLNARFHRVAVFTDFTAICEGKSGVAVSIDESIKLGREVDDQIATSFKLLNYDVVSNDKLFIGTYVVNNMAVADNKNSDVGNMSPPFHIDPDVTHSTAYQNAVIEAMRAFAAMAAGQEEKIKDGAIDPKVAKLLSSKYNADAIVLAIGASRRVSGDPETGGIITSSRFYQVKMPHVCIGVFHGFNGKLLWYGQRPFKSKQLNSAFRGAAKSLLSSFPEKGDGPYFAHPVK